MWLQHEILAFILGLNPKVSSLAAARWRKATKRLASLRDAADPGDDPGTRLGYSAGRGTTPGTPAWGFPQGVGAEPDGAEPGVVTADQGSLATLAQPR